MAKKGKDKLSERRQRAYDISVAGWRMLVDTIAMYTTINGHAPDTIFISTAVELILEEYFATSGILEANNFKTVRDLPKILAMTPVYDVDVFMLKTTH